MKCSVMPGSSLFTACWLKSFKCQHAGWQLKTAELKNASNRLKVQVVRKQ